MKKWIIINFCLILLSLSYIVLFLIRNTATAAEHSSKAAISLRVKNTPMSKVLETISNASGYTIILKTEIEDAPISIQLTNASIHEAIRRIFQNYNHIEIWDDAGKKIELYIWGNGGPPVSKSGIKRKFEPSTKTIQ